MAGGGGGGGYNGGGGGSGGQIYYSQNITVVGGSTIDITIGAGGPAGTSKTIPGSDGASTTTTIVGAASASGGFGGRNCNYIFGTASCPNYNGGGMAVPGAGTGGAPQSGSGGYGRNFLNDSTVGIGGSAYVNSVMALAPISLSGGGSGGGDWWGSYGVGYGAGGGGGAFTSIPGTSTTWSGRAGSRASS